MSARRFTLGLAAALAVVALANACASLDDAASGDGGTCVGPACEPIDASPDKKQPETGPPDAPPDGVAPTNPLCGDPDELGCLPDDPTACAGFSSDAGPTAEAGVGQDAGGDAGALSDGGPQFSPPGTGSEAGPPPPGSASHGCYVKSGANQQPVAQCLPAGSGATGAPCVSSSDCAPGHACVGAVSGQCRPYCCGDAEHCPDGTFCAERPQRDADLVVPVCVKADNCNLAEPYPCPSGSQCTCEGETACMVVRDKTTSCVVPGSGTEGQSCPCAWGYFCSKTNGKCSKLCTFSSNPDCGAKTCTPVPYLPDGWGVCV